MLINRNHLPLAQNISYKELYIYHLAFAEIRKPFYAWFDQEAGASRIDYYGGNGYLTNPGLNIFSWCF